MSGGVEGAGPIQRDEKGEAMVCTGCGTTRTVAAIAAGSATAFTCCPERKMIPARTMWHAWCDANDARPSLTAPLARTYAEGVEDAAKAVEALRREVPYEYNRHPCSETKRRASAAIRLLSQGEKA